MKANASLAALTALVAASATLAAATAIPAVATAASAKPRKSPSRSDTRPIDEAAPREDVDVTIQRTELKDQQGMQQLSTVDASILTDRRLGDGPRFEIGASSWVPDKLELPSALPDTTSFAMSGLPEFSLGLYSAPIARAGAFSLRLAAAASFERLKRSGTVPGGGTSISHSASENLYLGGLLASAEADVELHPVLSLYGQAGLLPVVASTTRTQFGSGQTELGLPLAFSAGIAHDLGWITASLRGVQLRVGADATVSALTDASFTGLGARAALSFAL
jgi:hypothetical protein